MSNRFAIPGFQPPDAPKEADRAFGAYNQTFEVVFLKNVSIDQPARSFGWYLSLETGGHIEELAYSWTDRFVYSEPGEVRGTINYLVKLHPDELSILPGVYVLRVVENGKEIFKKIVNVQSRPAVIPPYPDGCPRPIC